MMSIKPACIIPLIQQYCCHKNSLSERLDRPQIHDLMRQPVHHKVTSLNLYLSAFVLTGLYHHGGWQHPLKDMQQTHVTKFISKCF
jgi:hypothetical protein